MGTEPELVSLVLCDRIEMNPAARQYSLVGLFHSRRFASFPSPVQEFSAYAALHGGVGEGRITLVIAHAATEEEVYRFQRWTAFPGRGLISTFEAPVRKCVFPEPGRYFVTLRFEDMILTHRPLDIFQE